jgi:hypothetical protein
MYEDYIRHLTPHVDCFAGAYCVSSYEETMKMIVMCSTCHEAEMMDLRFLPCTKFSTEYTCTKKLQFAVDCFRENFGDNGFMRVNTSAVTWCSVCKSSQNVYCAVFHISTLVITDDQVQDIESQLYVCVNCQKQFINIVMKEQGFEQKLKEFQLKNMELLSSCFRVVLNRAFVTDRGGQGYTADHEAGAVHRTRQSKSKGKTVETVEKGQFQIPAKFFKIVIFKGKHNNYDDFDLAYPHAWKFNTKYFQSFTLN